MVAEEPPAVGAAPEGSAGVSPQPPLMKENVEANLGDAQKDESKAREEDIVWPEALTRAGEEDDIVRLALPGGRLALASKRRLAARAAFFAPLAEEPGPDSFGHAELDHLAGALAPGARAVLPELVEALGAPEAAPAAAEKSAPPADAAPPPWERFLTASASADAARPLHVFAAAHLLGAAELLDAAREWAAACDRRLVAAVANVDADVDAATLRMAADYELDKLCSSKLIHAAAVADSPRAVRVLAAEGGEGDASRVPPVDMRDGCGRTALHVCAMSDNALAAEELLQASACLEALCGTPDDVAEACDNAETGDNIADEDGKGHQRPRRRMTALHVAALQDSPEVVQVLLDARANVAACVKGVLDAVTPLHECAASDAARAACVLAAAAAAAAEAPVVWPSDDSATPTASQPPRPPAEVDIDTSRIGREDVAGKKEEEKEEEGDEQEEGEEEVQWSRFLDPLNAKCGPNGSTPLHAAAENDARGVTAALLEAKADAGIGDDQGDTPVHCAALYGSPHALSELFAHGAKVWGENASGELPLHLMAEFGPGCDGGLSASLEKRHFARSIRVQEILIETLRERGQLAAALAHKASGDGDNTALHAVARWDHLGAASAARLLAEARADLEMRNGEGRTALALSVRRHGRGGRLATTLRGLGAREPEASECADFLASALGGRVIPLVPPEAADNCADLASALGGCVRPLFPPQGPAAPSSSLPDAVLSSPELPLQRGD